MTLLSSEVVGGERNLGGKMTRNMVCDTCRLQTCRLQTCRLADNRLHTSGLIVMTSTFHVGVKH